MPIKVKKDMLQREYSWEAVGGDDPRAIQVDATLFNRRNGYEVLIISVDGPNLAHPPRNSIS